MKTVITPKENWSLEWKDITHSKELIYFLTWRNFKIRYKQTVIGALWAVLKPFILMVVFTIFFNRVAKIGSGTANLPYPVFSYAGLLFWNYFAQTTNQVGGSLITYQNIIKKIYFPRILVPFSTAVTGLVDMFFALLIYIGILFYYSITPQLLGVFIFIPLIIMTFVTVLGIGIFMAALNVRFRDVEQALPFFIQVAMFITPVIYPVSLVPQTYQWLLYLNPMTGIIELSRVSLLGSGNLHWGYYLISLTSCCVIFTLGLLFFKSQERTIGDYV